MLLSTFLYSPFVLIPDCGVAFPQSLRLIALINSGLLTKGEKKIKVMVLEIGNNLFSNTNNDCSSSGSESIG